MCEVARRRPPRPSAANSPEVAAAGEGAIHGRPSALLAQATFGRQQRWQDRLVTTALLLVLATSNLAGGVYLVRYSGGRERRRPEAVLVVGLLLLLTVGFLVSVAARVHTQQKIRQQMDHSSQPGRFTA